MSEFSFRTGADLWYPHVGALAASQGVVVDRRNELQGRDVRRRIQDCKRLPLLDAAFLSPGDSRLQRRPRPRALAQASGGSGSRDPPCFQPHDSPPPIALRTKRRRVEYDRFRALNQRRVRPEARQPVSRVGIRHRALIAHRRLRRGTLFERPGSGGLGRGVTQRLLQQLRGGRCRDPLRPGFLGQARHLRRLRQLPQLADRLSVPRVFGGGGSGHQRAGIRPHPRRGR